MVGINHRIDGDRHIGDGPGEEFFLNPFATVDGVGLEILGMCDQPGGVGENALAIRHLRRLLCRIIPAPPVNIPV